VLWAAHRAGGWAFLLDDRQLLIRAGLFLVAAISGLINYGSTENARS
jgi:hypothetical protein